MLPIIRNSKWALAITTGHPTSFQYSHYFGSRAAAAELPAAPQSNGVPRT